MKISSLARSSWFHSSSSFSCPFQLSLSCSLVLKAAEEEQPLGKDQAYLSSLLLTLPGQDPSKWPSPDSCASSQLGGWGILEAQGYIYIQDRPQRSCQEHLKTKIGTILLSGSSESCTLYTREILQDSQWGPTSIPRLSKMPSQLPGLDLAHTERSHTAAAACPHPFRGTQAPHCGRS